MNETKFSSLIKKLSYLHYLFLEELNSNENELVLTVLPM